MPRPDQNGSLLALGHLLLGSLTGIKISRRWAIVCVLTRDPAETTGKAGIVTGAAPWGRLVKLRATKAALGPPTKSENLLNPQSCHSTVATYLFFANRKVAWEWSLQTTFLNVHCFPWTRCLHPPLEPGVSQHAAEVLRSAVSSSLESPAGRRWELENREGKVMEGSLDACLIQPDPQHFNNHLQENFCKFFSSWPGDSRCWICPVSTSFLLCVERPLVPGVNNLIINLSYWSVRIVCNLGMFPPHWNCVGNV